jgi:GABA permease
MWLYPGLTWAVVIVIPVMLVYMATDPDQQLNIGATAVIAVIVLALAFLTTRDRSTAR